MNFIKLIQRKLLDWALRADVVRLVPFGGGSFDFVNTRKYLDFFNEGYKQNPIVFSCINQIGKGLSSLSIGIEVGGEVFPEAELPDSVKPLNALLNRPNVNQSISEFIQLWCAHIYLGGISFIRGVGVGSDTIGGVKRVRTAPELFLVRPDLVEIKFDATGTPSYKITSGTGSATLTAEEMFNLKFPNPENQLNGFSPMYPASLSTDISNQALVWNFGLLKNSAVPAGILSLMGFNELTKADRKEVQDRFDSQYAGGSHAGSTMVLDASSSNYAIMGHNPKDMDWSGTKSTTMREIATVLGVPSVLVGDTENSTYNNMETAERRFYENTVIPMHKHFLEELSYFILPKMGLEDVILTTITEGIASLQENEAEVIDSIAKAHWMTVNEQRARMPQPLEAIPGAAYNVPLIRLPGSVKPLQPEQIADAGDLDDPDDKERTETRSRRDDDEPTFPNSLYPTLADRAARIAEQDQDRERWDARYEAAIVEYWEGQEERVISSLGARSARAIEDAPFNPEVETAEYIKIMAPLQTALVLDAGQTAIEEVVPSGLAFDIERPDFKKYLTEDLAERSQLINETTANRLNTIIEETATKGHKVTAEAINKQYETWSKGRVTTIARTEVGRADIRATVEGYSQAGEDLGVEIRSEWLTARDGKVRGGGEDPFSHIAMDGVVTNADGLFETGQVGDVTGPLLSGVAGFDINCRCGIAPLLPGDAPIRG